MVVEGIVVDEGTVVVPPVPGMVVVGPCKVVVDGIVEVPIPGTVVVVGTVVVDGIVVVIKMVVVGTVVVPATVVVAVIVVVDGIVVT